MITIFEAAAPILVAGLFYLASAPLAGLARLGPGLWLLAVAAGGAFAGPVGIWAVGSLAGGLAFLLGGGPRPGCAAHERR